MNRWLNLPNIPNDGTPILFMRLNNTIKAWQEDFFREIGLYERLRFTGKEEVTEVGSLCRVDQTNVIRADISSKFVNYTRSLLALKSRNVRGSRLYLSRSECPNAKIVGEDLFEHKLKQLGFSTVIPERLSIKDQAALYDEASLIVAVEGSALHTLIFTSKPKTVLVFNRRAEIGINFRLQFSRQPHIRFLTASCMNHYALNFSDPAELNIDKATEAVSAVLMGQ